MSNKQRAFVYTHLGLGDMFTMNGAIRYLRGMYDTVYVVCKEIYKETVSSMYSDDPGIRIVVVASDNDLHPWEQTAQHLLKKGYDVFGCGLFSMKPEKAIYDFPNSFYDDMNIPRSVRRSHFHVPRTEAAITLQESFINTPYIVVHQEASTHTLPIIERLRAAGEKRLIINLTKNPSEQDGVISICRPFIDYACLMEGAEEIHLIDSSLFCFAMFLNLENVKRRLYYIRPGGALTDCFGVFEAVTDYV
jgi:hypothetical protein